MKFEVTVLGSNSAIPTANRNPSAQLLNVNDKFYLIDCGEGTQIQLRKFKIKFQRIEHIFISHLHGDHFFGLIGLLLTMELLGRVKPLTIHCHEGLKEIIELQLRISGSKITFPLHFNFISNEEKYIVDDGNIKVRTLKMNHRIACCGFVFEEKEKLKNLKKGVVDIYNIPVSEIHGIKKGNDFTTNEGELINNRLLVEPIKPLRSYAYCTDTKYMAGLHEKIKNVSMLYHEATFTEEHLKRAKATYHSTAKQAATVAKNAETKQLIIGHFSVRYNDLNELLTEAKQTFENTLLAKEGKVYAV